MKTKQIIAVVCLLLSAGLLISCQNNVNTDLEETLAPYLELEPIEEASNTTLTVRRGTSAGMDSYFAFDVSNIEGSGIISEGLVEGWCLEWDKPIAQNNDRHDGVEAYSTFGSEKWKPVNYLMSIKDQLQRKDPSLTYREIQVAMWSLIDVPRFDVDDVLASGRMPSRMMSNGQPNFSVDKVKEIVDHVRSNSEAYEYTESTPYLVFARTADDTQNGGFIPCESGDASQCEGYVSISGFVYVDGNADETKNQSESGIQNTTVTLTDSNGMTHHTRTEDDGFYSFVVFTGDEESSFTLGVAEQTSASDDFNEGLFDSHTPTTATSGVTVSTSTDNVENVNFGFEPQVEKLIQEFNEGVIVTNTEEKRFWIKQLLIGLASEIGLASGFLEEEIPSEVPLSLLLDHIEDIENLLQETPFQLGENKVYSSLLILLRNNTELNELLSELLTAEFNVVSGRGSGSPELDLALMGFGEAAAIELIGTAELRASMQMTPATDDLPFDIDSIKTIDDAMEALRQYDASRLSASSVTTEVMPLTSSASAEDAVPLLRSFNLSGGGGGGTIGPR